MKVCCSLCSEHKVASFCRKATVEYSWQLVCFCSLIIAWTQEDRKRFSCNFCHFNGTACIDTGSWHELGGAHNGLGLKMAVFAFSASY